MGGGMGGMGGGGFFSVPPEKIVSVEFNSVCLEHGKPEPGPRHEYRLVRVEQVTQDPALKELLSMVATGRINTQVAQAAAWHLSDDMDWDELANKVVVRAPLPPMPYFTQRQLLAAQQLIALAETRAAARDDIQVEVQAVRARPVSVRTAR
jgi:hypothetical protein